MFIMETPVVEEEGGGGGEEEGDEGALPPGLQSLSCMLYDARYFQVN
jgi:hypothetical protein